MEATERIQMMMGQMMFQIVSLQVELEKAKAQIKELTDKNDNPSE